MQVEQHHHPREGPGRQEDPVRAPLLPPDRHQGGQEEDRVRRGGDRQGGCHQGVGEGVSPACQGGPQRHRAGQEGHHQGVGAGRVHCGERERPEPALHRGQAAPEAQEDQAHLSVVLKLCC